MESLDLSVSHMLKEIQAIKNLEGGTGFPRLITQGISVDSRCIYIVIPILGPSLQDLFDFCGGRFSLKTTLMLFYQLLQRLEFMNLRQHIHRDLKPSNIMMGLRENSNTVHIIDFGLARSFIDPKTGEHIPEKKYRSLVGTCLFCSPNSHKGTALSCRDDLITLGYVILLFLRGRLPW